MKASIKLPEFCRFHRDYLAQAQRKDKRLVDEAAQNVKTASEHKNSFLEQVTAVMPSQEFDAMCDELLSSMPDRTHRQILTMRMEGFTQAEIATALGYTERNIRYKLKTIKNAWKRTLDDER